MILENQFYRQKFYNKHKIYLSVHFTVVPKTHVKMIFIRCLLLIFFVAFVSCDTLIIHGDSSDINKCPKNHRKLIVSKGVVKCVRRRLISMSYHQ